MRLKTKLNTNITLNDSTLKLEGFAPYLRTIANENKKRQHSIRKISKKSGNNRRRLRTDRRAVEQRSTLDVNAMKLPVSMLSRTLSSSTIFHSSEKDISICGWNESSISGNLQQ
jgi:hypothetical protein